MTSNYFQHPRAKGEYPYTGFFLLFIWGQMWSDLVAKNAKTKAKLFLLGDTWHEGMQIITMSKVEPQSVKSTCKVYSWPDFCPPFWQARQSNFQFQSLTKFSRIAKFWSI